MTCLVYLNSCFFISNISIDQFLCIFFFSFCLSLNIFELCISLYYVGYIYFEFISMYRAPYAEALRFRRTLCAMTIKHYKK